MTRGQRIAMYLEYLTREGYRPTVEGDGEFDVVNFKHEGGSYLIAVEQDDESYFRLIYPSFWRIDSEDERLRAYRCANEATAGFKVAKVYVTPDRTNVSADADGFLRHPSDYEAVFARTLSVLPPAVAAFAERMNLSTISPT